MGRRIASRGLIILSITVIAALCAYACKPRGKAEVLFDGKTLAGWQSFKNRELNSWDVQNGTLHCKPYKDGDKRGDLMTVDMFGDFDLSADWKISPKGNSGIIYRVTEKESETYWSGPEYQVLDDEDYPVIENDTWLTGGNFDLYAPQKSVLKPIGQWNTSRIVAKGKHIQHWLNGVKVVDYEIGSADWKKRVGNSKYKDAASYAQATKGHIALQDHGHEVWFKNIVITEL